MIESPRSVSSICEMPAYSADDRFESRHVESYSEAGDAVTFLVEPFPIGVADQARLAAERRQAFVRIVVPQPQACLGP